MTLKTPHQDHEEALRATFWPTPVGGIADAPLVATSAGESSLSLGIRRVTVTTAENITLGLAKPKSDGHRCVVCGGTIFNCPRWDS
jgi:hypothetical protein